MNNVLDSINLTELAQKSANSEEFMKAVSDAMYTKLANEKQSMDDLLQQLKEQKPQTAAPQSQKEKAKKQRGVSVN